MSHNHQYPRPSRHGARKQVKLIKLICMFQVVKGNQNGSISLACPKQFGDTDFLEEMKPY
jgi:hypothetical protein